MTPAQKERLEKRFTNVLQKKHPGPSTRVVVSDEGKTAVMLVDGKAVEKRQIFKNRGNFYLGGPV